MKDKKQFNSPTKGRMDLDRVVRELLNFINDDQKRKYRIVIGTDSEGRGRVDFVTAIIIHRLGRGGRYFWRRIYKEKIFALKQRIFEEVSLSLALAQELLEKIRAKMIREKFSEYGFEIHIDVGQNGETREMIQEVVGMVRGSGFEAKTKPEAYGASTVADRHV